MAKKVSKISILTVVLILLAIYSAYTSLNYDNLRSEQQQYCWNLEDNTTNLYSSSWDTLQGDVTARFWDERKMSMCNRHFLYFTEITARHFWYAVIFSSLAMLSFKFDRLKRRKK